MFEVYWSIHILIFFFFDKYSSPFLLAGFKLQIQSTTDLKQCFHSPNHGFPTTDKKSLFSIPSWLNLLMGWEGPTVESHIIGRFSTTSGVSGLNLCVVLESTVKWASVGLGQARLTFKEHIDIAHCRNSMEQSTGERQLGQIFSSPQAGCLTEGWSMVNQSLLTGDKQERDCPAKLWVPDTL